MSLLLWHWETVSLHCLFLVSLVLRVFLFVFFPVHYNPIESWTFHTVDLVLHSLHYNFVYSQSLYLHNILKINLEVEDVKTLGKS